MAQPPNPADYSIPPGSSQGVSTEADVGRPTSSVLPRSLDPGQPAPITPEVLDDPTQIAEHADVRRLYRAWEAAPLIPTPFDDQRDPLSADHWFLAFHRYIEGTRGPVTAAAYQWHLRSFHHWWQVLTPQAPLTIQLIRAYRLHLHDAVTARTVSARTANTRLAALRQLGAYFALHGLAPDNPFQNIKSFKVNETHARRPLEIDAIPLLLKTLEHPADGRPPGELEYRNVAMAYLMLKTGLRLNEVVTARLQDLVRKDDGHADLYVLRKGQQDRDTSVELVPAVLARIDRYLDHRSSQAQDPHPPHHPLFATIGHRHHGTPLTTNGAWRQLTRGLAAAGLRHDKTTTGRQHRIVPHSFRHTFATTAIEEAVPLEDVQVAMHHKKAETTKIYLKEVQKKKAQVERKITKY